MKEVPTNQCSLHKQDRKWIYSIGVEQFKPLIIKEGALLESKFECTKCNLILLKALGYEIVKKHGRRRKKN